LVRAFFSEPGKEFHSIPTYPLKSNHSMIFKKQLILFSLLIVTATSGFAQWQFQSGTVAFSIKNAGLTVEGDFTQVEAKINFNPDQAEKASIEASISTESINTGINLRDKHLQKSEYFDVAKFPKISLKLISLTRDSKKGYNAIFNLTMKGISKELKFPVEFANSGKLQATFTIDRRDFKVGGNSWTMGDNVKIQLSAQLQKI